MGKTGELTTAICGQEVEEDKGGILEREEKWKDLGNIYTLNHGIHWNESVTSALRSWFSSSFQSLISNCSNNRSMKSSSIVPHFAKWFNDSFVENY